MKDKDKKRNVPGSTGERGAMPRHAGDPILNRMDYYNAEEAGVKGPRDIRAVGNPPSEDEPPEPDRGKEFSGPGRRRDPDDAG